MIVALLPNWASSKSRTTRGRLAISPPQLAISPQQIERLHLGASVLLARMLRVELVDPTPLNAHVLPARRRRDSRGNDWMRDGDVMHHHAHRAVLGLHVPAPLLVRASLDLRDGLVARLLELLRQVLCSLAHDLHSFTTASLAGLCVVIDEGPL